MRVQVVRDVSFSPPSLKVRLSLSPALARIPVVYVSHQLPFAFLGCQIREKTCRRGQKDRKKGKSSRGLGVVKPVLFYGSQIATANGGRTFSSQ